MNKIFIFLLLIFLFFPKTANAQENNKFGIHIIDENDLENAAELVNSNGGEWGYVTVVIREDERNEARWQQVFDKMRRLKLIPIVRLATKIEKSNWKIPEQGEARNWAEFLHSLNWPIKERFVIFFNEPNHAKEWGGNINPEQYADLVAVYEQEFRKLSDDFKILPAGLDLAAANTRTTMDAAKFWQRAQKHDTFLFSRFDYWNSHSYPNPGFSGKVTDTGKKSIRGYEWEISFLENLGLRSDTKVFITETGWLQSKKLTEQTISEYYKYAFSSIWNDERILAITPFLLNYQDGLFSGFSWKKPDGNGFYEFYQTVKDMKKIKGEPEQIHSYVIEKIDFPDKLVARSEYKFKLIMKNTGQSIWSKNDNFALHFSSTLEAGQISIADVPYTEPGHNAEIIVKINTDSAGANSLSLQFNKDGQPIQEIIETDFEVLPPPSLEIKVLGWFGYDSTSGDYSLMLKDQSNTILEMARINVIRGIAYIPSLYDVIPGNEYKVTIERKDHISKSRKIIIKDNQNELDFGRMLPSVNILDLIVNPFRAYKTIFPI